jgi:hypothetical protein
MLPILFDANFRDNQVANVSAHWLKPSGPSWPSAMSVGCSSDDNKNSDGKPTTTPTATTSMLANYSSASISTTTTAPATDNAVYRLGGTDTWACKNCKIKADKWFMQKHNCSGKK